MTDLQVKATKNASHVYLFKNGFGMIVKTFEFPSKTSSNSGLLELIDIPSHAVHGTFWVQPTTTDVSIKSIRSKKTGTFVEKPCLNVEDLIKANAGENVHLNVVDPSNQRSQWISGKIQSYQSSNQLESHDDDDDDRNNETSLQPSSGPIFPPQPRLPSLPEKQGNLVILETIDDGILGLPSADVRSIRSETLKTKYQKKVFRNCLSIDYENRSESNEIGLMKYLTYGITWVPSYDIVLLNSSNPAEKRLNLSSKAVILNDIENVHVKNLFCIVGFPNISKFASVVDPTISNSNVKEFLRQLQQSETTSSYHVGNIGHSTMSNSVMMQQMVLPHSHSEVDTSDINSSKNDNDDFHLYDFHDVLLEKNKRLTLPIFNMQLPYKDVYNCEIALNSYSAYGYRQEKQDHEEVWHSIEIKNQTNHTWTTAPAIVTRGLQEQQFLGQDKITYTLRGSTVLVNLTKALDIHVKAEESVTNTNPSRITFSRQKYQTDTIDGIITVTNHKTEDVSIVLNVKLTGKIVRYSVKPAKDTVKADSSVVNQNHEIRWELDIKAKQSLQIEHSRHFNKPV